MLAPFFLLLPQIISFKFFLDWSGGLAFTQGEIKKSKNSLATFSISLGMMEYDFFSAGASFEFVPSILLFFPSAFVSIRYDSPSLSVSGGGGIGPGIIFGESPTQQTRALLGFRTYLSFGNWIKKGRILGHISPSLSAFLGQGGGFIISFLLGFSITASQ